MVKQRKTVEQLREAVERKKLRFEMKLVESASDFLNSWVNPAEPLIDDPSFWQPVGPEAIPGNIDNRKRGEQLPYYLTWFGLKWIRDISRKLVAENEFAINALTNRVSYIVGKGFQYKATVKDRPGEREEESADDDVDPFEDDADGEDSGEETDPLALAVQKVIDRFCERNAWPELEQEIVWRCDRDGECFLRLFDLGDDGVTVRIVEPEHVRPPAMDGVAARSFGIDTEPDDVESVIGYRVIENPDQSMVPVPVDAGEVIHIKLNTDRNAKRGMPTLYPVRKNLERADAILRNMSTLAAVQASFAVLRKHKRFSGAAVQAFQQANAQQSYTNQSSGQTNYLQFLKPGGIVDAPENTEYEFPAHGVNASSFVELLQAELRAIASRLVMPEYMLTADASNANYSSTLVAEAPSTKNFERLQAFYARRFGDGGYCPEPQRCGVMWRVIKIAVDRNILPREALSRVEIQAEGPSLVARDKASETTRSKTLSDAGVLSKPTWAKWEGLDYEQEKRQGAGAQRELGGGTGGGLFGQQQPPGEQGVSADTTPPDLGEWLLEDAQAGGFTGVIKDSKGREYHYANGRRVKAHPGASREDKEAADYEAMTRGMKSHGRATAPMDPSSLKKIGSAGRVARVGMMRAKELWRKLPRKPRKVVAAVFHGLEIAMHKSQAVAFEVAKARGASVENARRLAKTLGAIDTTLSWVANVPIAHTLLHHLGASEAVALVGSKISGVMPTASLAYVAYSGVRNPLKTMRAAWKVLSGHSHGMSEAILFENAHDVADDLLDRIEDAGDGADWYLALFHAAMDATRDPHEAMDLADEAFDATPAEPDGEDATEGEDSRPFPRTVDLTEEGFTGVITDSKRREYHYVNGKRVKAHGEATDKDLASADRRAERAHARHQAGRDDAKTTAGAVRKAGAAAFTRGSDRTEAMVSALTGHRWKSNEGGGYDTEDKLSRWVGRKAGKDDATLFLDAKGEESQKERNPVGYAEGREHAAKKANEYQKRRANGEAVINAVMIVHRDGVYLHLGIDPATTPKFGESAAFKRKIVGPGEIGKHVTGQGGILPAVRLSSSVAGREGLASATPEQVAEIHKNLRTALQNVTRGNKMAELQQHLDKQAEQALKAWGKEIAKNKTAVNGLAETLDAETAVELAGMSDEAFAALAKAREAKSKSAAA